MHNTWAEIILTTYGKVEVAAGSPIGGAIGRVLSAPLPKPRIKQPIKPLHLF